MAFPDTAYVTAERTAVGPLTDPSPPIDASEFPALWWDEVDTADKTKGRAFKEDETELALDWLLFDSGAKTGWVRVLWSGIFSGVVPNTVRIYPPLAARASVAAGDTFGSFNAFDDDLKLYLTLDEAVNNDVDGYKDQTQYGNHATGTSMAITAPDAQVGIGAEFDGGSDQLNLALPTPSLEFGTGDFSIFVWMKTSNSDQVVLFGKRLGASRGYLFTQRDADQLGLFLDTGSLGTKLSPVTPTPLNNNTLTHVGVTLDRDGDATWYQDGSSFGVKDISNLAGDLDDNSVAASIAHTSGVLSFGGVLDEIQVFSGLRTSDEISEEVAATKNPGTYWGVWEFVEGGEPAPEEDEGVTFEVNRIRKDISAMLPDESDLRALVVSVKQIVRDMRAFKGGGWSFDMAFGTIEIVASQSAGTVSISNGDTDLVGVGTSFDDPDHTGYKILLGGVEYEIASVADDTNAVLTSAFAAGTDLSGDTYTAYQNRYLLAADTGKIYRVWDQTNNRDLHPEPLIEFESRHNAVPSPGNVARYSIATRSSTDVKRMIFRPYPTAIAKLLYLYEQEHTQVTGPGSNVDIPDELYDVIVQGVYAHMLGLLTNHAPESQVAQQRFVRQLSDAWRRDKDKADVKIKFMRQDSGDDLSGFRLTRSRTVEGP